MHSFKDGSGKAWSLKVTIGNAKTAVPMGLDLIDGKAEEILERMTKSMMLRLNLIWHFLVEKPDTTKEDFDELLEGQCLIDANEALWDEIIFFTQSVNPSLKDLLPRFRTQYETLSKRQVEVALELAESPQVQQMVNDQLESLRTEAIQKLSTISQGGLE